MTGTEAVGIYISAVQLAGLYFGSQLDTEL